MADNNKNSELIKMLWSNMGRESAEVNAYQHNFDTIENQEIRETLQGLFLSQRYTQQNSEKQYVN